MLKIKADVQKLHSEKCQIELVDCQLGRGLEKRYLVAFSLTDGELIAMNNALHESTSSVASDLLAFVTNAFQRYKNKL